MAAQPSSVRRTATTGHPAAAGGVGNAAGQPPIGAGSPASASGSRRSIVKHETVGFFRDESDWFMDLFGFREVQYEDTQRRLAVRPDEESPGCWAMESRENQRSYKVGRFATPSLRELRAAAMAKGGTKALPGKLRVQNIRGDVTTMIGAPENRRATFQVASQFNCLEYVGPSIRPEMGVTMYVRDRTQGPACCVSCGPATVYRNYFAEVDGSPGQRYNRQLNNLRGIMKKLGPDSDRLLTVEGGYTLATDRGLRELSQRLECLSELEYQALRNELRVGVHEDVQVTSMEWGACPVEDEEQTVTQVLGSACSVSYSMNDNFLWEPFARLVLSASYEATLWAALLTALRHRSAEGSRRVYLTCLGGGVFGNESRWITDAMHDAFSKFKNCGLEVYIVTYSGPYGRDLTMLENTFGGSSRW